MGQCVSSQPATKAPASHHLGTPSTHQLLGEQKSCVVVTLQGPGGKAQDVLLVFLDLSHGPVLPLQALLLPLSYLLQVRGGGVRRKVGLRIPPHSRMTTAASRGCVPVPGPYPQVYLGIIDQHSASLVQFLHDLQNGHLNIHLYTLLHVGHLANPSGEGGPHQVCSGRCSPGDTPMALESTYELRTSLVFFCSVACLSPRRFTSEAKSLRWFLTASSKNWYLRADRDRSGH